MSILHSLSTIFLIGMPGGSEWIFIFLVLLVLLIFPVLTIVLHIKNKELKKQIEILTIEKNDLLNRILNNR